MVLYHSYNHYINGERPFSGSLYIFHGRMQLNLNTCYIFFYCNNVTAPVFPISFLPCMHAVETSSEQRDSGGLQATL